MIFRTRDQGMSLVEVIIASSIIAVFLTALVGVYNLHMRVIFASSKQIKASFLAEETLEAVKFLRNESWGSNILSLSNNTDYYLVWQSNKWTPSSPNVYIDGSYERKFRLEPVERDAQSNIVSSGGTVDPNVRKLSVTIAWQDRAATTTKVVSTYITNLFDN